MGERVAEGEIQEERRKLKGYMGAVVYALTDRAGWNWEIGLSMGGQGVGLEDTRAVVRAHGLYKRGKTALFDVRIVNLYAESYLCMLPVKALTKANRKKKDK